MTIAERMDKAMADLERRWNGRRKPKAFYLSQDDWDAFIATKPPFVQSSWGNNPPKLVTDPAFRDVPVRLSESKTSRLYQDPTSSGCPL